MGWNRTSREERGGGGGRSGGEAEVEAEVEIAGSNATLAKGADETAVGGDDGRGSQIVSQKKRRSTAAASTGSGRAELGVDTDRT